MFNFSGFGRKRRLGVVGLVLAVMLTGCIGGTFSGNVGYIPPPEFSFDKHPPIALHANDVVVKESYEPPLSAPNVEHQFKAFPAQIIRDWAQNRVRTNGQNGTLTLDIIEASVVEENLDVKKSFMNSLRDNYDRKLVGRLRVRMSYKGPRGNTWIEVEEGSAWRLPESSTMQYREQIYNVVLIEMSEKIDSALQAHLVKTMPFALAN